MKFSVRFIASSLLVAIAVAPPVPAYADAMQDIQDKRTDIERTLQEIEKYAALNGGNTVPDNALENEIRRLETHLKQIDLRLESLPPCTRAPVAPNPGAATTAIKGCTITPPELFEARQKRIVLELEIKNLTRRIDEVRIVKTLGDYLLKMKGLSANLGVAFEMFPSGVSSKFAGPLFDFIKVLTSAADSRLGLTQPGQVINWRGREEYHDYLNENAKEINELMSKRAMDRGLVDPAGKLKVTRYEAMIMGNDFVSQVAKREIAAKTQRLNELKKQFDELKKKIDDLQKQNKEREKNNQYFEELIRRLQDTLNASKWVRNPAQFERMQSELTVTVVDDKTGQSLQTATVTVAPKPGTARTAGNPYEFEGVTPGTYSVTSTAPGYVKETSSTTVTACQAYAIVARLKKKPIIKVADIKDEEGHLLDDINVDVAALAAGGTSPASQKYQRVSLSFMVDDPGSFTVTGTDTGDVYETTSANVNAEAGQEVEVHLVMRKKGATLVIEVWDSISNLKIDPPPGAQEPSAQLEALEGQPAPSREPYKGNGELLFSHIAPGRYKYTAHFCGWEVQTGEFTISADDIKNKRVLRKIFLKPTKLDSYAGTAFEHGASEHIDGFKVTLTGLGPRKGYRYETEEGKDVEPNVVGLRSGAFVIKGPIYSGRYKLEITRKCFQPLIIDEWWVFCGIEPNANGTFSSDKLQLHPTTEFDKAAQQVRSLMTKLAEERKKAAEAADQIADARRKIQDLPELAQALVTELETVKQMQSTLSKDCSDAGKLTSELNDASRRVADAVTKIASLADTAKASAKAACDLSDKAQKASDPTKASDDGNKSKELAAEAKKTAEDAKKIAKDAHKSYETAVQKGNKLKELEQRVSDFQKAFSASSGKLKDLRERLDAAEEATKSLSKAQAAATESARLLATIRQLLQGCSDAHPGKQLLENAEQAASAVSGESKRATDEEGLLKGFVSGAAGAAKQADGLGKEIETVLTECANVEGSETVVSDAKTNLDKIDAFSLAAQNSTKFADECAAKAIAKATDEVTVPDVSRGGNDPAALLAAAAPFTGTLVATNQPPPAGSTKLFSNQEPLAGTKANPRTEPLKIFLYQQLAENTSPSPSPQSDLITVPDVSGFNNPDAMLAAAGPDMIGMIIATNKTPPKGSTKLLEHQEPLANTKSERGKPLKIFIYQSLADTTTVASTSPTPTPDTAVAGIMPDLTKLTIDEATARLPSNMSMGGVKVGKKPLKPELALTIYWQNPAPKSRIVDMSQTIVVTVNIYGEAASEKASPSPVADDASPTPAEDNTGTGSGDWVGTWGVAGPDGFKISRAGPGYILVASLTDGKPVPGKEQGGSLVFSWELDLRDVVGIIGQTEKIGKKEDSTMGAKYIFTHNGDKLDMVLETTEPGGKVKRDSFKEIPRVGN